MKADLINKFFILAIIISVFPLSSNAQWEISSDQAGLVINVEDKLIMQSSADVLYFRSIKNLYKSTDKGLSWAPVFESGEGFYAEIDDYCVDGDRIWVLGNWALDDWFLFYSNDAGETWEEKTITEYPKNAIIYHKDILFMACPYYPPGNLATVYRSFNNGETWEPLGNHGLPVNNSSCRSLFQYQGNIFAFYNEQTGFYFSKDQGDTWQKCNNETSLTSPFTHRIHFSPLGLTVTYYDYNEGEETFYTPDGIEWIKYTLPEVANPHIFTGNYSKWIGTDSNDDISFSADKGQTWQIWNESESGVVNCLFLYFHKDIVFALNSGFLYRRPLSEAIVPPPAVPDEIESTGGIDNGILLEFFGVDSPDELPENAVEMYLETFEDQALWDSPGESMQPGTCSMMGLPTWKINSASLQLYIRDVIFKANSPGPDPIVDMHFNRQTAQNYSTLGQYWSLGMDMEVEVDGLKVFLTSGNAGRKMFYSTVIPNQKLALRNSLYPKDSLYFDAVLWHYHSHDKRLDYHFSGIVPGIFLLDSITDPEKNCLKISRNVNGKITKIRDAAGREIVFNYTGNVCTGFEIPDGRKTVFTYNGNGLLSSVADMAGLSSHYSYNSDNDIDTLDIEGKISTFAYSEIHGYKRITHVKTHSGKTIDYNFIPIDSITNITTVTADGVTKSYTNISGKSANVSLENGVSASRTFNAEGLPESFYGKGNQKYMITYDENDNPVELKREGNTIHLLNWDKKGNLISKTNAMGNQWSYGYDEFNRLTKITSPENSVTNFDYYANGLLKSIKKGKIVTGYVYDKYGNIIEIVNPNGGKTKYKYSPDGYRLVSVTSPGGKTTSYTYDKNNRPDSIIFADGSSIEYIYDCCIQTGKRNENGYETFTERNNFGLITLYTDEEGLSTSYTFDERKQPESMTDPLGNTTQYRYNNSNLVAEVIDNEGNKTGYWYNALDKLKLIKDANNKETRYLRNASGELMGIVYPNSDSVIYARDAIGNITSVTNGRKQTIEMSYDKDGNPLTRQTGSQVHSFTWDASTGMLKGFGDQTGNTVYERDSSGFIRKIIYPNSNTVEFNYDKDGNYTGIFYPGGFTVTNTFNNRGRIQNVAWGSRSIGFTYDATGNNLREDRENGSWSAYTYSKNNRLKSISHYEASNLFVEYIYTRDANGNILNIDLLPAIKPQKGADSWADYKTINDNQLSENLQNDVGSGAYYQYDKDGNCAFGSGTVQFEARYNELGHLKSFKKGNDSVLIDYDAMGNMKSIYYNGLIKLLYYDHKGRLLFESDAAGNIGRYYIYKAHRIIAFVDAGVSYYLQYDQAGNTVYIRNEGDQIVNRYAYSSFGEILAKEEQIDYRFKYNGAFGVINLSDGYYLMRTRLYQATNGRFLQRDPLNFYGDLNGYRYAGNNPFSKNDPLGMDDDENSMVNAGALDGGYDYEPGISGGTADAYNPNLKHSRNSTIDPLDVLNGLYEGVSNSPLGDFIPTKLADIVSLQKAAKKFNEGAGLLEIGFQFVPFNNTLELIYKEKKKEMQKRAWDYYHMPDGREKLVEQPYGWCTW